MVEETANASPSEIKNRLEIHPSAMVCKDAVLEGDITIGPGTIVQPLTVIRAVSGPIIIGSRNNFEGSCTLENVSEESGHIMVIGDENTFEAKSVCRARAIGNNNSVQMACLVGPSVTISNGCTVGVRCQVLQPEVLPEKTVFFGEKNNRRIAHDGPPATPPVLEMLSKHLPSYHHMIR